MVAFLVFTIISAFFNTHNLIKDPGYENFSNSDSLVYNNLNYWHSLGITTPDVYINDFSNSQFSDTIFDLKYTSNNLLFSEIGYSHPHGRNNFTGIVFNDWHVVNNKEQSNYYSNSKGSIWWDYREYLIGELKSSMKTGKKYRISGYSAWSNYSTHTSKRINLGFVDQLDNLEERKKKIKQSSQLHKNYNFYLTNALDFDSYSIVISDEKEWNYFSYEFISKGNEKYFVIGNFESKNFRDYLNNEYCNNNEQWKQICYIFLSDLKLELIE